MCKLPCYHVITAACTDQLVNAGVPVHSCRMHHSSTEGLPDYMRYAYASAFRFQADFLGSLYIVHKGCLPSGEAISVLPASMKPIRP